MNKQEVFNKIWNHFVVDKAPISIDGVICKYRNSKGAKCAVGLLIKDEFYSQILENYFPGPGSNLLNEALEKSGVECWKEYHFLDSLQIAHDGCFKDEDSIGLRLTRVASTYDLSIPK